MQTTITSSVVAPDRFRVLIQWWASQPTGQALMYLTREELRDLADAIIAHELTLEELERRKPV